MKTNFKNTYPFTAKLTPDASQFYYKLMENVGKCKILHYKKQAGKWNLTSTETVEMSGEYYLNTIESIEFFKDISKSEKYNITYTSAGKIVTKIISVAPDASEKTERYFTFD